MSTLAYTPLEEIEKIRAELQTGFNSGKTKSVAFRKYQLLQFAYLIQDNVKAFEDALASDLGRHALETNLLEIGASLSEIMDAYKNVESWAKPEKPALTLTWMFMRPTVLKEPKGVVLIISPFNYPLWLCVSPMCGAIAAGNAIVIKPSESCPAIAALLTELIPKYLDPSLVRVVNGAIPETTKVRSKHTTLAFKLLTFFSCLNSLGVISFIRGTRALGGLSQPPLHRPSRLYLWSSEENRPSLWIPPPTCSSQRSASFGGKFTNGGQTCVAPDYVLVPKEAQEPLIDAMKSVYTNFYPETTGESPTPPQNVTKLVHHGAFNRVNGLVQNTKGTIVVGGQNDEATKYFAPTIVRDVQLNDSLMSEEIFGPVLPIVPVENVDAGLAYVNSHDHPLALYVFSQNEAYKNKVFNSTQSGSAVANETIVIPGVTGLPFGGIGPSGCKFFYLLLRFFSHAHSWIPHWQGKFRPNTFFVPIVISLQQYGFDMFTHLRASIDAPGWIDKVFNFRFPPYTTSNIAKMKARLGAKLPPRPTGPPPGTVASRGGKWFLLAFVVAILGALTKMKNRMPFVKE
ncbi:Aldehyde dehydrogenase [Mycena sanguinolenta]|uniref:Aldehyde dehydrogenase n=1 Tax=Mycena sanguinolenta TaxID=230812 RepID=A0A8H7D745_9AGAR|nr:Aldehyde dehydrogenase [Mycena sanguinolenta]